METETELLHREGVYIRVTDRFDTVHLEGDIKSAMREILCGNAGGKISVVRSSDGFFYVYATNAMDEGRYRNGAASYYAGVSVYGDCIVLPKTTDHFDGFTYQDARRCANMMREIYNENIYRLGKRNGKQSNSGNAADNQCASA
ncbi:MAG: hypothetical protein ACI3XQ_11395 [Eubacteriales bacterium]